MSKTWTAEKKKTLSSVFPWLSTQPRGASSPCPGCPHRTQLRREPCSAPKPTGWWGQGLPMGQSLMPLPGKECEIFKVWTAIFPFTPFFPALHSAPGGPRPPPGCQARSQLSPQPGSPVEPGHPLLSTPPGFFKISPLRRSAAPLVL